MEVIYVDNHILLVNKKAGLPTQTSEHSAECLHELAKQWVKKEFNKPGAVFLEPIHRLDKPVSGLVLFARTSKALSRLQEEMREGRIKKTYYAKVEGKLPDQAGTLKHSLLHDDHRARVVSQGGKLAILHYKVSERGVVEIQLETGRYHQIRCQFSAIGCPIVGDKKYGSRTAYREDAIALHHGKLEFIHPVTKELVSFQSKNLSWIGAIIHI